jgi:transcriptional regulator with XRE-family HTH domain
MIGNRIKRIREIKCIKQETVAKALGVSQQLYSQIEAGQIKLTGEKLDKIAEALGLSMESIMDFDETKIFENNNFTFDSATNTQNNYTKEDNLISELKKVYEAHIADLQKQLQTIETKHEKQVASLEKQLEALYKLLDK